MNCTKCGEEIRVAAGFLCEKCLEEGEHEKLYFVKIGRETRRGGFQELTSRVVAIHGGGGVNEVCGHFLKIFQGFIVRLQEIEQIEILNTPPKEKMDNYGVPIKRRFCLKNFGVNYTEAEEKMHKEWKDLKDKAGSILLFLENSIRERYERMFYSAVDRFNHLELETTISGTVCKSFPVKGEFTEEILEGGVIEEPTGND